MIPFNSADVDRAAERYFDRMLDAYYGVDEPDPECGNCIYWQSGLCHLSEYTDEGEPVKTDSGDYCEQYEPLEDDDDDDWMSDDAWEGRFDRDQLGSD